MAKDGGFASSSLIQMNIGEQWSNFSGLTRRQRLRIHIGGLLFIGLGCYIIWKTFDGVFGLFPHSDTRSWRNTRHMFVLYCVI
jgi:hypothetical protein